MAMKYTRLTEPLVRDGGDLRPASWDEALDRAAEGFRRTMARHGVTPSAPSAARRPATR